MVWQTVRNDLRYQLDVRTAIVNRMDDVVTHNDGTESKLLEVSDTSQSRLHYLQHLHKTAMDIEVFAKDKAMPSIVELTRKQGRKADLVAQQAAAEDEFAANKSKKARISIEDIRRVDEKMTVAKLQGENILRNTAYDDAVVAAKGILKADCVKLLTKYECGDSNLLPKMTKKELSPLIIDLLLRVDPHAADKTEDGQYCQLVAPSAQSLT